MNKIERTKVKVKFRILKGLFWIGRIKWIQAKMNSVEGWNGFDIHLLKGSRMGLNALWPKKSCSLNCSLSAINCFEGTFQPITLTAITAVKEIYLKFWNLPWICMFLALFKKNSYELLNSANNRHNHIMMLFMAIVKLRMTLIMMMMIMMMVMMMMMMMMTCSEDVIIKLKHLNEGAVEQELGVSNSLCPVLPHPEYQWLSS